MAKLPSALEFLVRTSYSHFSHSSLRRGNYQDLHAAMVGKKARQLNRLVETRWLSLGDALNLIVEQWDVLKRYFQQEANTGGSDVYSVRQLADLYSAKNKVLIVFVSERLGQLNHLNRLFQGEQPDQSILLDQLMAFFFAILEEVIIPDGLRCIKNSSDPFSFDLEPYRKDPSSIHFG